MISFANRFIELQECFTNKSAKLKAVKKQKKMINEKANNEIEILQTQLFELQSQKKEMENEITKIKNDNQALNNNNQEITKQELVLFLVSKIFYLIFTNF